LFGTAGLEAYTERCRHDPAAQSLMEAIGVTVDDAMGAMDEPVVTLTFRDGLRVERMVPRATGSAERPMRPAAVEAKFRELARMSLPPDAVEVLWRTLGDLEKIEDCGQVAALLAGHADRSATFR
jgi:2-methylcitrate dehydratase PrpD